MSEAKYRTSAKHPRVRLLIVAIVICGMAVGKGQAQDGPLDPNEAAKTAIVPEGFSVTVFAAEPDVRQPIAFCIDDRGRLWVAEAYNYPRHGTGSGDRILIFEDVDGDGRFDKRTVFYNKLNYVTGLEVGFGGAWVMSPPYFYFIPDRDGDDQPDGEPQVLLDGFGNHANAHNLANGFSWGPDGWLYGTHGRTNWSLLGRPGTPDDQRVRFDGGVYRYHPVRHVWEWFSDGTTNPWGIDFDDFGQAFISNIGPRHLYYAIQGAHYEPWRNRKSSQYAYRRIPTIADHHHWPEVLRRGSRDDRHRRDTGEDHAGVLVYLGDNWPDQYRNTVLMCNLHGRAINNDLLARKSSGYTASHGRDPVIFKDRWFVGVTLRCAPDGTVYVSDWSETGECHFRTDTRRKTGRIYRISYGKVSRAKVDIASLDDHELVDLQLHKNDWHVRHARRVLQERAAAGQDMSAAHKALLAVFHDNPDVTRKLRALWALHVTGGIDETFLIEQLDNHSEYIRAWAIRLMCERESDQSRNKFAELARNDPSAFVRLHLASALQRLPLEDRWQIAAGLVSHEQDSEDPNLPLMYWYGIEPLVSVDTRRLLELMQEVRIPLIRQFIARRAASGAGFRSRLDELVRFVSEMDAQRDQADILAAIGLALRGRRDLNPPREWAELYAELNRSTESEIRLLSARLGLLFGDAQASERLRHILMDSSAPVIARRAALQDLVEQRDAPLLALLRKLIQQPSMRSPALRGLAAFEHPDIPAVILKQYASLTTTEKQDAVNTLASRPTYAVALLDAIEKHQVPRGMVSASTVRQMRSMDDQNVSAKLAKVWGVIADETTDKAEQIGRHKALLSREFLEGANLAIGRAIYSRVCANCHTLFGQGAKIGPDITGSNRANIDYILENIIDPSALVERAYQLTVVQTQDGRIVTGILVEQTDATVTIQTAKQRILLAKVDVENMKQQPLSMMPEGLLNDLKDTEFRDLIAYLASPIQVPLPKAIPGAR